MPIGRTRTIGSALAMLAAAAVVANIAFGRAFGIDWSHLLLGGVLGLAGFGLTRRSLPIAVLARGATWLVFAPTAVASALLLANGRHVGFEIGAIAASSALALLLSPSALHTREASDAFAPLAFRKWLLAGSTTIAAAGVAAGFIAAQVARYDVVNAVGLAALSAAFVATTVGVVRMRAWGVLLGVATSATLLLIGLMLGAHHGRPIFTLAAAPALLMLALPIFIARRMRLPAAPSEAVAPALPMALDRVRIAAPPAAQQDSIIDPEDDVSSDALLTNSFRR